MKTPPRLLLLLFSHLTLCVFLCFTRPRMHPEAQHQSPLTELSQLLATCL